MRTLFSMRYFPIGIKENSLGGFSHCEIIDAVDRMMDNRAIAHRRADDLVVSPLERIEKRLESIGFEDDLLMHQFSYVLR